MIDETSFTIYSVHSTNFNILTAEPNSWRHNKDVWETYRWIVRLTSFSHFYWGWTKYEDVMNYIQYFPFTDATVWILQLPLTSIVWMEYNRWCVFINKVYDVKKMTKSLISELKEIQINPSTEPDRFALMFNEGDIQAIFAPPIDIQSLIGTIRITKKRLAEIQKHLIPSNWIFSSDITPKHRMCQQL